jgi:hypothetical protein
VAGTQSKYNPANNLPVPNTSTLANCTIPPGNTNCAIPDPFVLGATYIGGPQVGPTGADRLSVAAVLVNGGLAPPPVAPPWAGIPGQFFPFHNHDDYKATNNGIYPGGMFTMIMTTP